MTPTKLAVAADFVMEMGLDSELPTYSGGLGILAGDLALSLADLGLPTVFVTLLYKKGYTSQKLDRSEGQLDTPVVFDPSRFLERLQGRAKIEVGGRTVEVAAWEKRIKGKCEVPVLFLDTDVPENDDAARGITDRLYGGDATHRLAQEMVLGIGGFRMLKLLGYSVDAYRLNESHAALLTVELLKDCAQGGAKAKCIFTTHTPVPAGQDSFPLSMVKFAFQHYDWMNWDAEAVDGRIDLSKLALKYSETTNAVSLKHRHVSRLGFKIGEIGHVTNGVYHKRWIHDKLKDLYSRYMPGWEEVPSLLSGALSVPEEEIARAHSAAKSQMLEMVERKTGERLEMGRLTIGLARRLAAYKRNNLILADPDRLIEVAKNHGAIQIVYSGKSHPLDDLGRAMIRDILRRAEYIRSRTDLIRVTYLENYDIDTAKSLVGGCDLWLNTPRRPWEACGTSGMKAAMNGALNFSEWDGWWMEGGIEGVNGWGIGKRTQWDEVSEGSDSEELEDIHGKLSYQILPMYYTKPERWWEMAKNSIATVAPQFNSYRMAMDYASKTFRLSAVAPGTTMPKLESVLKVGSSDRPGG